MSADVWASRFTGGLGSILEWLERHRRYRWLRLFLHRHDQAIPPTLFIGGVTWDALTLQRIDALFDNLILGIYLLLLGAFVVLTTVARNGHPLPTALQKLSTWAPSVTQFLSGGLFSAYVIYYTQSASFTTASLFLLILVVLLVANEVIWSRFWSTYILLGIYFLALFCYFTFFLPTMVGTMGFGVFLASGFLSAGLAIGLILYLDAWGVFPTSKGFFGAVGLIGLLLGTVVFFYVNQWIPPVPLALRDGGVYNDVTHDEGAFVLHYEEPPWYQPWTDDSDPFHIAPDDTIHCFAAVFAPTSLETKIYHHWQKYDPVDDRWLDTDRIGYEVVGGRRNGYRGVTFKRHIHPGEWRVTVEAADGRPIGRIRFNVIPVASTDDRSYTQRYYR